MMSSPQPPIAGSARYPWRTKVGLGVVALATLLSLLQTSGSVFTSPQGAGDPGSRADSRFSPLRPLLPPGTRVGYVSDATSADGREEFRRYLLAQYALAPVIVLDSRDLDLVVGDFGCKACTREVPGFTPVWDGGAGVVLLRRTPP